jgi:hypothetical protein
MYSNLPYHKNPNTRVFGIIGEIAETDEGKSYVKISDNTLNVGWEESGTGGGDVTTTTSSGPTTTTTSGPTTTTTSEPTTTTTSGPTTTTTAGPAVRTIRVIPGNYVWNLDTQGPITFSGNGFYNVWEIKPEPLASSFVINCDINGARGGEGGDDGTPPPPGG